MKNYLIKVTFLFFAVIFLCAIPSCSKDEPSATENQTDNPAANTPPVVKPAPARPTTAVIKFKMEPGERHTFSIREEMDMTEQNKSRITSNRIRYWYEIEFAIECLEIDPSDGACIISQDWIKGKGADGTYKWDSTQNQRAPDYLKRWRRLINNYIKLAIMPDGEIGEIWNGNVLADAILYEKGVDKKDYTDDDMDYYESKLENMLDDVWESKENMFPSLPRRYPDKPLKIGNTWITTERASTSRDGYVVTEMELAKINNNSAFFNAKVSVRAGDDPTDGNAIARVSDNYNISGQGEIEVDLKTGLFKNYDIKASVTYDADIDDRLWQQQKQKTFKGNARTTIKMLN